MPWMNGRCIVRAGFGMPAVWCAGFVDQRERLIEKNLKLDLPLRADDLDVILAVAADVAPRSVALHAAGVLPGCGNGVFHIVEPRRRRCCTSMAPNRKSNRSSLVDAHIEKTYAS